MISSRVPVRFVVALCLVWVGGVALGQTPTTPPPAPGTAPPPPVVPIRATADAAQLPSQIGDTLKKSANLSTDDNGTIDAAVDQVCKQMANSSQPATQSACRDWLIQGLTDNSGAPASIPYLQYYSQSLNNHLVPLVSAPDAGLRLKIEAGIVGAKVAEASMNSQLKPLARQLMLDASPAVVLGGIKTATPILPAMLANPAAEAQASGFANEVVAAAIRNYGPPLGQRITATAYAALEPLFNYGPRFPGLAPKIVQYLVPAVLDLQKQRIALYAKAPPCGPVEDANSLVGLFDARIWNGINGAGGLTPAQQADVLQVCSDLVGLTAQWAQAPTLPDYVSRSDLLDSLRLSGRILHVFSDLTNGTQPDGNIFAAALSMEGIGLSPPNSQIGNVELQVVTALATYARKAGANINPPPVVDAAP